ncbi:MAG: HNH endonuclease [Reyranella sp.]|jgi:5-methylcytosine-specific restriction endonuclease McrA|nr:HNH endonuclease [Reyranella sp.]
MDRIDFHAPRRCLLEPIQAIFDAAKNLDDAVDAHLAGDRTAADALILEADRPEIYRWTDAIWGRHVAEILRIRPVANAPPTLRKDDRPIPRAPVAETRRRVIDRDGYHCRFCGIPVIDRRVRSMLREHYPIALRWGRTNNQQHAAFQCMWLQYDHVLPNGRGGDSSADNIVVTCAPCNFGRMERTLEEVGVLDPRSRPVIRSAWDGLERIRRQKKK